MHQDVLDVLAEVGVRPDNDGNVTLYHATSAQASPLIIDELALRPPAPDKEPDPALRLLQEREGGFVWLASSPSIGQDLAAGEVVLEVVVAASIPAELNRPPQEGRVDLAVQLRPRQALPLVSAKLV